MSKMYPPCMMMPGMQPMMQQMKQPKERSFLKEYMAFQKFMKELEKEKKGDEKKPDSNRKGKWQEIWVEDVEPRKYTILETFGLICLCSIPLCALELGVGMYLMHLIGIK